MPYAEHRVSLRQILSKDETFRISTETSGDNLIRSIRRIGLLHPPILRPVSAGFAVVSGFRRLAACRALAMDAIPAKVLDSDVSNTDCIAMAIADNAFQRPLNSIELSRGLKLLSAVCPDMQSLSAAALDLGLPDNWSMIGKLLSLSDLPHQIQDGVVSEILSLAMALELGQLNGAAGILLAGLFGYLKVGLNKQREILTLIQEVAHRDQVSIEDVLNTAEIQDIVHHEKWDRSRKTVLLREYLKRRRYPHISSFETIFESRRQSLNLDPEVALIPPRDFEGDTFSFHIQFTDPAGLRQRLSRLQEIASGPVIENILAGGR